MWDSKEFFVYEKKEENFILCKSQKIERLGFVRDEGNKKY